MNYLEAVVLVALITASVFSWWVVIGGAKSWTKKSFNWTERIIFTVMLVLAVALTAGVVVLL